MPGQATLAEKVAGLQNGDDRLFALVGDDGELEFAFLEIENGVRMVALREDRLALPVVHHFPARTDLSQEHLGIERRRRLFFRRHMTGISGLEIL